MSTVFGQTKGGEPITRHTLTNGALVVQVMDYGATITSVVTPDVRGVASEVTLGFDGALGYIDGPGVYFGCVAGRVANRIGNGRFVIDGNAYSLAQNNGPNSLHGGLEGFDKRLWKLERATETSVTLSLESADGDQGYPGALAAAVTYSLPTPTSLRIEYSATVSGAPTLVNLTNHAYWNLADGGASPVVGHEVELASDWYTPADATGTPTGEVRAVRGAMDLRTRKAIAAQGLAEADQGNGYDHNYCLRAETGADGLRAAARVYEPSSGRWMSVRTDQPGVQFYTGNFLDGFAGRHGVRYGKHHGFCLETQRFPDSANNAHFPTTLLRPGETYRHATVHEFGVSAQPPEGSF